MPSPVKTCCCKSTTDKFCPCKETDMDLLQELGEDMVGGPSIVFTRQAVVNETFNRVSTNCGISIGGVDASQLYLFCMCQAMPTGLHTRWQLGLESGSFRARQNKTRSFEKMVMSYFQRFRPQCHFESFYTTFAQKKVDAYSVDGFCGDCNTVFEATGRYYQYFPCQRARLFLTEEEFERGIRKRELDDLRKQYVKVKGYNVIEMYNCDWMENVQDR